MQTDADLAHLLRRSQDCIVQDRFLDSPGFLFHYKGHASGFVPAKEVPEGAVVLPRCAMDDGQILFPKGPFPDLPGKLRSAGSVTGQHHQTADHPVQPVDRPHIRFFVSQRLPNKLRQPPRLVRRQHPGGLDADQNIRVAV